MSCITIYPSKLKGEVIVPPSKSGLHRSIICAALAKGKSHITPYCASDDINATIDAMAKLSAQIEVTNSIKINGGKKRDGNVEIDAKESGSTLRFLIPIAAALGINTEFIGCGRLPERPLTPYIELFDSVGLNYDYDGALPLKINGKLDGGIFKIRGDISSQFITGLLFALPLIEGKAKIEITTELESKPYVDITIDIMKHFGVVVKNENYTTFEIEQGQYSNEDYTVEHDWSQAAFWCVASAIGNDIKCKGMNINSHQGDKAIIDILKKCGAKIIQNNCYINVSAGELCGVEVDASNIPDLVPILAVLGSLCKGQFKIINAARLRIKESDRLMAITKELKKLGADITEFSDGLIINGKEGLTGGIVDTHGDHRIAMAMAIAASRCSEPVTINDYNVVAKSYPDFFDVYTCLGGRVERGM